MQKKHPMFNFIGIHCWREDVPIHTEVYQQKLRDLVCKRCKKQTEFFLITPGYSLGSPSQAMSKPHLLLPPMLPVAHCPGNPHK